MIRNLRRTGFFREMPHGEVSDPSIMTYIGKSSYSAESKKKICHYLDSGITLIACFGLSSDIIHPERGFAGCPGTMTDGIWVWPGDLSYYVAQYSLKLNDEFLKTMAQNNWQIPITEDALDYNSITIDGVPLL